MKPGATAKTERTDCAAGSAGNAIWIAILRLPSVGLLKRLSGSTDGRNCSLCWLFLAEENISWRLIGRGTNLLVRDEGFAGVIILLGAEFKTVGKSRQRTAIRFSLQAEPGTWSADSPLIAWSGH